jgi:hypothetical protein
MGRKYKSKRSFLKKLNFTFLEDIAQYFLIGLFALGFIIVYGSLRAKGFNIYIFGTGLVCALIPVIIFFISERVTASRENAVAEKTLRDLKTTGIQIPVDLTKCVIKSSNSTVHRERYSVSLSEVSLLNEISGHGDKNIETIHSSQSVVEYTCRVNGRKRTFRSNAIPKDKTTLMILLELQKETIIYLDRDHPRYYYFDLDFIDKE